MADIKFQTIAFFNQKAPEIGQSFFFNASFDIVDTSVHGQSNYFRFPSRGKRQLCTTKARRQPFIRAVAPRRERK